MDRDIQKAVEAGQRTEAAMLLVRNWCAHVRVKKFGGTGMIEQMTGLPIGNHGLECDFATAGGMYTWDLRESALDFYDRNCIDCKHRKPVGVPNLSTLVKERDDARAAEAARVATEQQKQAEAQEARVLARTQLRQSLGPLSSAIVDHIDEFDAQRDQEHRDRLCESARLAPEHFVVPLLEYIFELTEKEPWFTEAGLTILDYVKADPARIARLAIAPLGKAGPIDTHARVLLSRIEHIDSAQITNAVPTVIEYARPYDEFHFGREREPKPELLQALWAAYPAPLREALDRLLSSRRRYMVELGARGLLAIHPSDPLVLKPFLRSMVSKFSRAELLLDDYDEYRSSFRFLRDAIVAAFEGAPEEMDALVQEYVSGADKRSKDHGYKIYEAVLRYDYDGPVIPPTSRVHRIAFKRLLWAATTEESEKVLQHAHEMLRGRPRQMIEIARAELDGLLGAVLLLDDRLRRHDEAKPAEGEKTFLDVLERSNQRSTIIHLMKSLIEWASSAAKGDPALMQKVVALFGQIPEGRNDLHGIVLGCIEHFSNTVEGLKLVLPHLYYGLVGPSSRVRAYAAEALSDMRHDNIPPLVYEAFSALLLDPYVVVHQAAVDALGHLELPEELQGRAAQALLNLVKYYSQKSGEDRFLIECVRELAYELRRLREAKGKVGQYLVQVLLKTDPLYLKSNIRSLGNSLGKTEGFVDLVLKLLPGLDGHNHHREDELRLLAELPDAAILSRRDAFEELGMDVASDRPWLAAYIVQELARAGAWSEASRVADAGAKVEPTVYNESRLIYMTFMKITAAFEEAIAEGRSNALEALSKQWEENVKREEEFKADVARRNSRSSFPHTR